VPGRSTNNVLENLEGLADGQAVRRQHNDVEAMFDRRLGRWSESFRVCSSLSAAVISAEYPRR
jgi:hypothetical protein